MFCFKKSPRLLGGESVACVEVEGAEAAISVTRLSRKKGACGLGFRGVGAAGTMDGFGRWFEGEVDRPC